MLFGLSNVFCMIRRHSCFLRDWDDFEMIDLKSQYREIIETDTRHCQIDCCNVVGLILNVWYERKNISHSKSYQICICICISISAIQLITQEIN